MVLIMVIMTVVAMMIFSIGVISRGVSHSKSSESQISRIKAEQLSYGVYAKAYSDFAAGGTVPSNITVTLDNRAYTANVVNNGPGGINNTNSITVTTSF